MIHPRENELVLGTHGRSIYIADVSLVQQLTDSITVKDLYAFSPKSINVNAGWGRKRNDYEAAPKLEYQIPFYTKAAGKTKIQLKTDKGLVLRELTDDSEVGINYGIWDYTIDPKVAQDYEKYLNDIKKKDDKTIKVEEADNKQFYIKAGKYKVIIETANGQKAEKDIEVKNPERRNRRLSPPSPMTSPDAFEEWYEDGGFEDKK